MTEPDFGHRLREAIASSGPLCVGIDPHNYLLDQWQLAHSAAGLKEFGLRVIDAAVGRVAMVKPQVAFFERFGSEGYAALESVLSTARSAGLLVIADAKRADLGSTMDVYAQAWLSLGGRLEADAMTVNAYHGVGALSGAVALAQKNGKGLFVLSATSNSDGVALQTAVQSHADGSLSSVAAGIVKDVIAVNAAGGSQFGSIGVVLGATVSMDDYGISVDALAAPPNTPILAPGFGAQGAEFSQIPDRFGATACVIISASRSVLAAGPLGIGAAMDRASEEIAACRE
jgi:orotidine-5'-phosphate decarboxylase